MAKVALGTANKLARLLGPGKKFTPNGYAGGVIARLSAAPRSSRTL